MFYANYYYSLYFKEADFDFEFVEWFFLPDVDAFQKSRLFTRLLLILVITVISKIHNKDIISIDIIINFTLLLFIFWTKLFLTADSFLNFRYMADLGFDEDEKKVKQSTTRIRGSTLWSFIKEKILQSIRT